MNIGQYRNKRGSERECNTEARSQKHCCYGQATSTYFRVCARVCVCVCEATRARWRVSERV